MKAIVRIFLILLCTPVIVYNFPHHDSSESDESSSSSEESNEKPSHNTAQSSTPSNGNLPTIQKRLTYADEDQEPPKNSTSLSKRVRSTQEISTYQQNANVHPLDDVFSNQPSSTSNPLEATNSQANANVPRRYTHTNAHQGGPPDYYTSTTSSLSRQTRFLKDSSSPRDVRSPQESSTDKQNENLHPPDGVNSNIQAKGFPNQQSSTNNPSGGINSQLNDQNAENFPKKPIHTNAPQGGSLLLKRQISDNSPPPAASAPSGIYLTPKRSELGTQNENLQATDHLDKQVSPLPHTPIVIKHESGPKELILTNQHIPPPVLLASGPNIDSSSPQSHGAHRRRRDTDDEPISPGILSLDLPLSTDEIIDNQSSEQSETTTEDVTQTTTEEPDQVRIVKLDDNPPYPDE